MTIQNDTVDMVKRSSNDFSFIKTLDDMINNREFKDGLHDFYVGNHNKYSFVWEALSVIGQEVGDTVYENVLNYIDIASNIDLCKVRSLQSISKCVGTDFSVLHGLENFPQEITEMIDILSINRKYIMQTNFLCEKLIQDIARKAYEPIPDEKRIEIQDRFSMDVKTPGYITEEKYNEYLSGLYYDFMYEMVNLPYNTGLSVPIWWIEERDILENDIVEDNTITQFKALHAIPNSFDERAVVDGIENCTDQLDNYDGYVRECLELEIERRSKTLRTNDYNDYYREKYKTGYDTKLKTRYSYDRKEKVRQYINMIQSQFNGSNDIRNINGLYDIDKNYFVIKKAPVEEPLIDIQKARKSELDMTALRTDMISKVASKLSQITIYISKIRDILKIQAQKYYAKGTFNLLAYVINEYLLELSQSDLMEDMDVVKTNIKQYLSNHSFNNVDIIEYFDTTEYYNISCQNTSKSYNKKSVNQRFWEQDQEENTNSGFCFNSSQISDFYMNELELNNKVKDINDFLNTVFNYGATASYTDGISSYVSVNGKDEDTTQDINTMYLTYSGNKYGYKPYMNMKNRVHSSVQVHPYLKNFIEYTMDKFPIVNAFYNDTVNEAQESESIQKLSSFIGKYGETVNVAVNNQYDYSGYKTRYETTPHDGQYDVEGYDGIFFPPAIDEFLADSDSFIDSISSMTAYDSDRNPTAYGKYYQKLGYTKKCYKYIAEQLDEYRDKIIEIAREKDELSDVHDIFRYSMDAYGNMYMLLKKYDDHGISYGAKKSVPGQLWIRRKDNPIPFPAFIGRRSAIDTQTDFNGNIRYLASISCIGTNIADGSPIYEHNMADDETDMSYIYDMEFSTDKSILMLAVYPVNDISSVGADGKYNDMISAEYYKDIQHSDIIINELDQWYDTVDERDKLYFQPKGSGRYSKENSYNSMDSKDVSILYGKSFIGFFKNGKELGPVFINKTYDKSTDEYTLNNQDMRVSIQTWTKDGMDSNYNELKMLFNYGSERYKIKDGQVEFSNEGKLMTFAFLTRPDSHKIQIQSYVGKHNNMGQAEYLSQTSGYNILEEDMDDMNSFDMLDLFVTTVDTQILNGELVNQSTKTYNLNSDASYIPSYPGDIGYTDVSKTKYSDSPTKSFEFLGDSGNIEDTIDLVNPNADSLKDISSYINEYTYGMTWEDYNPQQNNTLRQFTYNQIQEGSQNKGRIIWSINLNEFKYAEKDLSTMTLVMYNKRTNGKNPYYVGKLKNIAQTSERQYVSLKNDISSYQGEYEDHEVKSKSNPRLTVTGTYDYFSKRTNRQDSNHLENVEDIQLYMKDRRIVVTFCPQDYEKEYFIRNNTVTMVLCDPADLRVFNYFHILDHNQSVKEGKIDGVYLSSIELSDYSYLSDVPGLSGFDELDFKYSEQDVFDLSNNAYYFPCFNIAYPYRAVDVFMNDTSNNMGYNVIQTEGIFNQRNLFMLKLEKNDILKEIEKIYLPISFSDNECMIAYEEYVYDKSTGQFVKDDSRKSLDVIDPRILSCVEMFDMVGDTGVKDIDILPKEETSQCIDRIYDQTGFNVAFLEQTSSLYTMNYDELYIDPNDFEGIDKLFNVYVNYKKESDGTITMFFNYYNYINTPFVKIKDNKTAIDTREGTYLKLKSGEDGLLNIELQFKEYDEDGELYGFSNVKVATYRIFNISDDKPKVLMHKVSGIEKGKAQYGESITKIRGGNSVIYMKRSDIGRKLTCDIDVYVDSNKILERGQYKVIYPSNELKCLNTTDVEKGTNYVIVKSPKGITLRFCTTSEVTEAKTYSISIRNVEIYDTNGVKSKIETYPGQIEFKYMNYLRKESDNVDELILTESPSKKINI